MKRYNPQEIEKKWQKFWDDNQTYKADLKSEKPKYIAMSMFNYPSGAGIHVGHAMNYTISDVMARFKRQQGYESYHPVGWDSFGLPAENYAIKAGVSPQQSMATIIPNYHKQYKAMGWSNDWSKEIATHDPKYYKWTQWIFSEMYRSGLAYQDVRMQWWCDKCQTVLANEQIEANGKCWRHDGPDDAVVDQREVKQWFFKITDYADELLEATDALDWTDGVKLAQKNWIGRSVGAELDFEVEGNDIKITVFTTRADTIFSAAFIVLAPEHDLVRSVTRPEHKEEIDRYVKETLRKTNVERQADKEKTGVFTGSYAINPANGKKIPIWVGDFVIATYGTGAVFGDVHDERDFEFVKKFKIPARPTVVPEDPAEAEKVKALEYPYLEEGILIDSGEFTGMRTDVARDKIVAWLAGKGDARERVNYRIRDWSVTRQRYWGAPTPIIYCDSCKKHVEETAKKINFYKQSIWDKIVSRTKTVESRADNPDEPERRFKDIKVGDYLQFINKNTGEALWACVRKANFYASIEDLYGDKSTLKAVCGEEPPRSAADLESVYAGLAEGYVEKIKQNGLVTWEFELISPGVNLVPDSELPVILPELKDFKPSGDGRSALARATDWLKAPCPTCGKMGERETDTLDTYIDSAWYMMRYFDPENAKEIFTSSIVNKWMPIDFYNGADHATAHMIYARFVTRFFHKKGLVNNPEPFKKFLFNGKVTASDGQNFSKTKGNGVDPLEIINDGYGADALRTYLMFAAPLELWVRWDSQGVPGAYRFLSRLWALVQEFLADTSKQTESNADVQKSINLAIKKVTEDIEGLRYNTAIAAMMQCVNELYKAKTKGFSDKKGWRFALESLVQLVAPFAPHIAEQLWHDLGHEDSVNKDHWPKWNESALVSENINVVVQVNGKVRATISLPKDCAQADVESAALADEHVKQFLGDKKPARVIYVPGKLVNIVV